MTGNSSKPVLERQVEAALSTLHRGLAAYDLDTCADGLETLLKFVEANDPISDSVSTAAAVAAIAKAGGTTTLGDLLHRPNLPAPIERAACVVLSTIAGHADDAIRKEFVSHELVDRFVEILEERESYEVLGLAAAALANLSADVPSEVTGAIVSAGAVEALIGILRRMAGKVVYNDLSARTGQWAAAALCNLCRQGQDAAVAVGRCDGVAAIHACLEHGGDDAGTMHQFLCGVLCNLAAIDGQALLLEHSGMAIGSAVKVLQDGGRKSRVKLAAAQVISNLQGDSSPSVAAGLKQAEPLLREALETAAGSNGSAAMLREVSSALEGLTGAETSASGATDGPSAYTFSPRATPISPEEELASGLPVSNQYGTLGDERPRSPLGAVISGGNDVRERARLLTTGSSNDRPTGARRRLTLSNTTEAQSEVVLRPDTDLNLTVRYSTVGSNGGTPLHGDANASTPQSPQTLAQSSSSPPATLVVFENSPSGKSPNQDAYTHREWGVTWADTADGQGLKVADLAAGGLASLNRMAIGQQLLSVNGRGAYSTKGSQTALKMLRQAKPPVVLKLTLPPMPEPEMEPSMYVEPKRSASAEHHMQAQEQGQEGEQEQFIQTSAELFANFDCDRDGFLNAAECERAARALFPEEQWENGLWEGFCESYGADSAYGLDPLQFAAFRSHATLIYSGSVDEIRAEILQTYANHYPEDECLAIVDNVLREWAGQEEILLANVRATAGSMEHASVSPAAVATSDACAEVDASSIAVAIDSVSGFSADGSNQSGVGERSTSAITPTAEGCHVEKKTGGTSAGESTVDNAASGVDSKQTVQGAGTDPMLGAVKELNVGRTTATSSDQTRETSSSSEVVFGGGIPDNSEQARLAGGIVDLGTRAHIASTYDDSTSRHSDEPRPQPHRPLSPSSQQQELPQQEEQQQVRQQNNERPLRVRRRVNKLTGKSKTKGDTKGVGA